MRETPVVIDRRVNGQAFLPPEIVVVQSMTGGDVNKPAAGVTRDKFRGKQLSCAMAEWMLILPFGQVFRIDGLFGVIGPPAFLRHNREQPAKHNVIFLPHPDLNVLQFFVVSDGQIGGQRPRGRRPDNDERLLLADKGKFNEDTLADVVLIFHLRLGQGGSARDAPVYRLFAAINKPLFHNVGEHSQLIRLVFLV